MNTVKNIIQEMNKFIMSDTRINDSQLTNKARVIDKLNLPLGPS